jgi:hypothetical protein
MIPSFTTTSPVTISGTRPRHDQERMLLLTCHPGKWPAEQVHACAARWLSFSAGSYHQPLSEASPQAMRILADYRGRGRQRTFRIAAAAGPRAKVLLAVCLAPAPHHHRLNPRAGRRRAARRNCHPKLIIDHPHREPAYAGLAGGPADRRAWMGSSPGSGSVTRRNLGAPPGVPAAPVGAGEPVQQDKPRHRWHLTHHHLVILRVDLVDQPVPFQP